jgi:hypothetical protein
VGQQIATAGLGMINFRTNKDPYDRARIAFTGEDEGGANRGLLGRVYQAR